MTCRRATRRRPTKSRYPNIVIPSGASRRLFFAFASERTRRLAQRGICFCLLFPSRPVPLTPPKAPASDFSPQTASDANTDTPASDRSPYPTSPPAPPSTSTPPPANSAEAVPHSARRSPRCPPSAVAATSSAPPPAPASQPPWKPPPAHPPPCTNIRPPPAAQNPPSCAAGSLSAMASRARSCPSAVPIPADSRQWSPPVDQFPAASTPIQTPSQSTSNTPGARHNASTHSGPPPPATSSNASPKNSNTRRTAPSRSVPGCPASAPFLPPAPSRQIHACDKCRCSPSPAAASSPRKPSANEIATTPHHSHHCPFETSPSSRSAPCRAAP